MKRWGNIGDKILPMGFIAALLLIWEISSRIQVVPTYILPAPTTIIITLITNLPTMKEHILVTLMEALVGFMVSVVLAVFIAITMDGIPMVKKAIYPLIITSQTVPIITIAPLFAIWFGFGYLPKIVIVALVCFFPITISMLEGLASVEDDLLNLIKSMGAGKVQLYTTVKLPAAMPSFFSGLKISGTYSITGATIGEWVGGKNGLGVYMLRVKSSFATDKVFASIILITLLSIGMLKIISYTERKCMPWVYDKNKNDWEEE